jgi:ribose/xylose/arabinose/galactoside ABC-type transport system permease subunit
MPIGRFLMLAGLVIAGIGLLMTWGLPIGRLPGDFSYRKGNFGFYFPLATSIVVSIVLTLLMWFFNRR